MKLGSVDFFSSVGGRAILPQGARGITEVDPKDIGWNFGIVQPPAGTIVRTPNATTLYSALPEVQGKWDGKSTINHLDAARQVVGDIEGLIQNQPRGTCGGRAGSLTGDLVQCVLIAAGARAKFRRTSHAAIYYAARKLYNMLRGDWRDDNGDGVAGGSVPEALVKVCGYVGRDEDGDINYYGQGSDDIACQLGAGGLTELAKKIMEAGSDNFAKEQFLVKSAQELADGIAAGGIGVGSDMQGFTMQRDNYGFCSPQGTWSHYQVRCSVGVWNGRKGFGYLQSWGKNTPSGNLLPGHSTNAFGVDFDLQDRIIKSGQWSVVFGFPLWELQGGVDIPWLFR